MFKRLLTCTVCLLFLLPPGPSRGQYEYIDIGKPFLRKIPMAVPEFTQLPAATADQSLLLRGTDILTGALDFTGYFTMLDRGAFLLDPNKPVIMADQINFQNWTAIGAELLVTCGVSQSGDFVDLELRLFDTLTGKRLVGKRYHGTQADLRSMILRFCSEVIFELTGHRGIFDSKIAFVSAAEGKKEIYICDFDGSNPVRFTRHDSISLFPAWSSDGKWLAYTSYAAGKPDIYIREVEGVRQEIVNQKGINIAPAWIPGQFTLSATLSFSGNQEIYLLTGNGKIIKRITDNWASDLSPTWSPDGKKMAFVSNRTGAPQVYIQDLSNGKVERLTFNGDYNTQPHWSPRGNKVAYSSLNGGRNDIFVIDLERREPVQLTMDAGDNESPSWSPDGSLIVFSSTREGASRLYVMTAFGTDQRRLLAMAGEQSSPSWSNNISKN